MRNYARAIVTTCVLLAAAVCLSACQKDHQTSSARHSDSAPAGGAAAAPATTLTGMLRSGAAAVGGETTGWRLVGDGATGGFDLDVSKVQSRAKSLEGQRVTVTGRMTTRNWPERGSTPVLAAERIEPAPAPGAGAK